MSFDPRSLLPLLALLGMVTAACGADPASRPQSPSPAASASAPTDGAPTARDRLLDALREFRRPVDVTAALPPELRADVEAVMTRLDPQQRAQLPGLQGADASANALLHAAAGGQCPEAYYALAIGSAADDLFALRGALLKSDASPILAGAPPLAQAAAERWLSDQVIEVGSPSRFTPEVCDRIDRVALRIGRADLALLARQAAADLEPNRERLLAVAEMAARQLDVDEARRALRAGETAATSHATEAGPSGAREHVAALVAAAERVAQAPQHAAGPALLALARDLLELRRYDQARKLLSPASGQARSHLGLASALALANLDGDTCPGVQSATGNILLCAVAWERSDTARRSLALVTEAWAAGQGRDTRGVETYLGLAHVVPWIYGMVRQSAGSPPSPDGFQSRLQALQRAAGAAVTVSPEFEGLALFVDTLTAGFDAATQQQPGQRVRLPVKIADALIERARELGSRTPDNRFTQAAVLELASFLMQERDVLPLIGLLPDELPVELSQTRALLRMWCAIARQRSDLAEAGRAELFQSLPDEAEHPLERAGLILTMAEADVAIAREPGGYQVLEKIAEKLTSPDVPPGLRLRATIDQAGALGRINRERAAQLLEQILGDTPPAPPGSTQADLGLVAKTYLFVMRAQMTAGEEREQYVQKLTEVGKAMHTGKATASLLLWHELWQKELEYESRARQCGGRAGCLHRAQRQRTLGAEEIDRRIGAESGLIARAGVLSAGTVMATFNFSGESGLRPLVVLEPRLLAVEFPSGE